MIGIIDYGMGNLQSVSNALKYIGVEHFTSSDNEVLKNADKLILPGVGAFKDAIERLREKGLDQLLMDMKAEGKPVLGICLGMQLLFDTSTEFGSHAGLGLIKGKVVKLDVQNLKIPHMGWNALHILKKAPLFMGLPEEAYVYFVHSYHLETDEDVVSATTYYGKDIQIAAQQGNIYGLQFHPEKSGDVGLKILENFALL
ncbi:MAG: imidazole glycerol phosphate synthase subunit HisH [Firmicutes bacterium HGW-Firmicutes-5]|nr:imidazole glycerol phosphate synthase subunit HisH [Petrocella atlantisensis]PKM53987.1 MAG: imidazole glycerol phosphate synthase subunit HisH [Firmicutes bacterium HGW-Firmicutes-5]